MGKALLIFPAINDLPIQYPTGLYKIASYCSHSFDVTVIDQRLIPDIEKAIDSYLDKNKNCLCLGISVMTGSQINAAIRLSRLYKGKLPIVWGGMHPTLLPNQTIKSNYVDYIIVGDGEAAFLNLLEVLSGKKNDNELFLSKSNSNITFNAFEGFKKNYIDFEKYPINREYFVSRENFLRAFPLETSRGCPYQCKFCHNSVFQRKYQALPYQIVLGVINSLVSQYQVDGIIFQEDNFFTLSSRIKNILRGLLSIQRKHKLGWKANCRVDTFLKMSKDQIFIENLEKSNCRTLQFGVESGSNKTLKQINRVC